jgi:prepilin-type N-terminal cleavage/methylation domain-containing protein
MNTDISSAKLRRSKHTVSGFTIVELLIVVVVLAILAAVIIVSYNGVTRRAIETSLQADLHNDTNLIESDNQANSAYPASAAAANGGAGLKSSGSNVLTYTLKPYGYCITTSNPKTPTTYVYKSSTNKIAPGDCLSVATTLAGNGAAGYADGIGTAAQLNSPRGTAVDASGTIYFADFGNNRIRKITAGGVVTTLAGSGTNGFADGTGTATQFSNPRGIAVDSAGMVYVVDYGNNRIRKITPGGVVTTLAGSGTAGFADGAGATARFNNPVGIAVDTKCVVYVGDGDNNRVRKITSTGVVSTFAGSGVSGSANGNGTAAQFNDPWGVAVDATGTLFVVDGYNNKIRKITPNGDVSNYAGSGTYGTADGAAATAQFSGPWGIAVAGDGSVYVTDYDTGRIRLITTAGVVSTFAGAGGTGYVDGTIANAKFGGLTGIAADSVGTLYIGDTTNNRIRLITQ